MQVNLVSCIFVLDSEKNTNIRKNDIKKIKVIMNRDGGIPMSIYNGGDLKKQVRDNISRIIGSNIFHLEQVYTMDCGDSVDVIYLAVTNVSRITKLGDNYKLGDFGIKDNVILFDDNQFSYKTVEIEKNNNIEYVHEIYVSDEIVKRLLMSLLISYKKIRSNVDYTDIIFKFMGDSFTLEDVRNVYEIIKNCSVDKSNFRKKIIKYCVKTEDNSVVKRGYRPSQKYSFKPLKGDVWI